MNAYIVNYSVQGRNKMCHFKVALLAENEQQAEKKVRDSDPDPALNLTVVPFQENVLYTMARG